MKQFFKNLGYYIVLPIIIVLVIVFIFNNHFRDIEKAVNVSATLIQVLAILIGGLWAYHKFDWIKRAESAIKMKAMLMGYEQMHNATAMQYRSDQIEKKDWLKCWTNFSMSMIPPRNQFASQVHLSCYLPQKIRQRLFDVVWLSLNKGKSPKDEDIDENWKKFGEELKKIKKELDDLVSK